MRLWVFKLFPYPLSLSLAWKMSFRDCGTRNWNSGFPVVCFIEGPEWCLFVRPTMTFLYVLNSQAD